MPAKAFNPQIFLEFLCYCVFGGLIFYLVSSEKYLTYVTPRLKPYLYFTSIVMGVWALNALGRLFRPQHKLRSAHCFVLVIPIVLLLLPHAPVSASNLSGNYIGGSAFSNRSGQSALSMQNDLSITIEDASSPEDKVQAEIIQEPLAGLPAGAYVSELPGLDMGNKRITVAHEDFSMWLTEMYTNIEKYQGYTVVMTGFVFNDPEFLKEDEFVPARLMMSCCVGDLAPAGILCKYDQADQLQAESWVTVEGTLTLGQHEYDGVLSDEPQIRVTKITPAEAVEGYIYPY
ncbi:putative membrane protein [Desulfitobacterium sp. LBE]|uniref:TIGR03943 family putative permease subunit n=1 Tax=Desulfitobacterium sp. LBE TaxID=884086 RepID=UPI0011993699|nr:TIGR03943 family protein [Desulfitobacterium sp. LBE]TWH58967.1 putative membrane protein [Desulfitobacterium sp. LBE]